MPHPTLPTVRDCAHRILVAADLALDCDRVDYDDGDLAESQVDVPLTLGLVNDLRTALGKPGAGRLRNLDRCSLCDNHDDDGNPSAAVACSNCLMRVGGAS
ncbi:MAG TPA: hypothetical protein VM487_12885 [Phycisphaerae bacterium]|nr:hypothetical protein [Phycisphaerae bacterium]